MLTDLLLFAQNGGEEAEKQQQPNLFGNILFLLPVFILLYILIVVRPGKKQEAQRKAMLANLDKDDKVLTTGGIIGWVVSCTDEEVTLRIADNVKIKVVKSAIAHNYTKMDAAAAQPQSQSAQTATTEKK
jgi:preprotein translocase subunit YajC